MFTFEDQYRAFLKKSRYYTERNAQILYLRLLNHWLDNQSTNVVKATVDDLTYELGCSAHTLIRARDQLVKQGFIRYVRHESFAASEIHLLDLTEEKSEVG